MEMLGHSDGAASLIQGVARCLVNEVNSKTGQEGKKGYKMLEEVLHGNPLAS